MLPHPPSFAATEERPCAQAGPRRPRRARGARSRPRRSPSSSSTPTRASSPSGAPGRRSRRTSRRSAAAPCASSAPATGRRCSGGCGSRASARPADIVLGLDTNLTAEAKATGLFAPHGIAAPALDLPIAWDDDTFLPYDWGYFAFVYDKTKMPDPPRSFEELIASEASIVIHDPRSSTPGPRAPHVGEGRLRRPGAGDLGGAGAAHRDGGAGLERGLRPVPRTARSTWRSPTPPRPPTT